MNLVIWAAHRFDSAHILPLSTCYTYKICKKKCFILLSFFAKLQTFGQLQRIAAATAAATVVAVMTTMVGGGSGICSEALIASLIAFIIPMDVLCIEYNFVAAAITKNGGQERKKTIGTSRWHNIRWAYSLFRGSFLLSRFSHCAPQSNIHKSGIQDAGRANRNRHTESSWHFNYISFYRFRMRCAFRLNTKHIHTLKRAKLSNKTTALLSTVIEWNGMERWDLLAGTLWFKSDHEVHICELWMEIRGNEERGRRVGKFFGKPLIFTCSNLCGEWTQPKSMH